jgi:hypothetical protein
MKLLLLLAVASAAYRMEAVFLGVDKGDNGGTERLRLEYSNETRAHIQEILSARVNQLVAAYCQGSTSVNNFAQEHAQKEGQDLYDVCADIVSLGDALAEGHRAKQAWSTGLRECREAVKSDERQKSLALLLCLTGKMERERDGITGIESLTRWSVDARVDAALADLHATMACPQAMSKLAIYQLDVEYKRDGVRKAQEAGHFTEERASAVLKNNPIPSRGAHLRILAQQRIDTHLTPRAQE